MKLPRARARRDRLTRERHRAPRHRRPRSASVPHSSTSGAKPARAASSRAQRARAPPGHSSASSTASKPCARNSGASAPCAPGCGRPAAPAVARRSAAADVRAAARILFDQQQAHRRITARACRARHAARHERARRRDSFSPITRSPTLVPVGPVCTRSPLAAERRARVRAAQAASASSSREREARAGLGIHQRAGIVGDPVGAVGARREQHQIRRGRRSGARPPAPGAGCGRRARDRGQAHGRLPAPHAHLRRLDLSSWAKRAASRARIVVEAARRRVHGEPELAAARARPPPTA